jgi:xylan 1,4-beta-xylosidase
MAKPQNPTTDQYARLEKAGQLAKLEPARQITPDRGKMKLKLRLPRQGVSLLVIERL